VAPPVACRIEMTLPAAEVLSIVRVVMSDFAGFPGEAAGFFRQLARHNNRDWFEAHKHVYERACREPMKALVGELDPLATVRVSRINRDMRFARDGKPYKTYLAAGVRRNYISLTAEGLWVGTGLYRPEPAVLQRLRAAIADDASGASLTRIVAALKRKGYDVDTHDTVASAPRGYPADHPRIGLLRMKDIFAGRLIPPGPVLSTRKVVGAVRRVMADVEPLGEWLRRHVTRP
jgi:uncharacterized protein (TIGR02453 family)